MISLEPLKRLYAGANHQDVCKQLMLAEQQRVQAEKAMLLKRSLGSFCLCSDAIVGMLPRVRHPHAKQLRVSLPMHLKHRMTRNVCALQYFWACMDLQKVDKTSFPRSALNRYRMFLHLKQTHPHVWIIPTVDIEFCWLAHIFRTELYWTDMKALGLSDATSSHSLFLHSYGEVACFSQAVEATKSLWEEQYDFPSCTRMQIRHGRFGSFHWVLIGTTHPASFQQWVPIPHGTPNNVPFPDIGLTQEDILTDVEWLANLGHVFHQLTNYYQKMHGPSTLEDLVFEQVVDCYDRFFSFCTEVETVPTPLPNALDLVWRAHQTEPIKYREECMALLNRELRHHPWAASGAETALFEPKWIATFRTNVEEDWQFHAPNTRRLCRQLVSRGVMEHLHQFLFRQTSCGMDG